MCKNVCSRFNRTDDNYRYCESCTKFIGESNLYKESKLLSRYRCSCCRGLVRTKIRNFYVRKSSAQAIVNINFSS